MRAASERAPIEKRLEGAGWGLLFIWVGLALTMRIGWGAALVGVGLIALGVQLARRWVGLALDGFSVTVGGLFVAGGIWEMVNGSVGLVPLLCFGVGLLLLVSAIAGKPRGRGHGGSSGPAETHGPA